ncbi:MAG: hypothetical protein O7J95_07270 [Planctomycetota bacterium]|nr:hypothetical protein [Planctomycetota bacterium]
MPSKKFSTLPSDYLVTVLEEADDIPDESAEVAVADETRDLPTDYISAITGHRMERPPTASVLGEALPESAHAHKKVRITAYVSAELRERARNAASRLSVPGGRQTISGIARGALEQEVERLEREHNDGQPFSPAAVAAPAEEAAGSSPAMNRS